MFAWRGDEVLICDIMGRGWCVPSGRVEPNESSMEASLREAREEAGAIVKDVQYIGSFQITEKRDVRWADCFTAHVEDLAEIQAITESRGRKFVTVDLLPTTYHEWNELTSRVFAHSLEILRRAEK
jgi:8-oxo-dGTP diphosphatase